MRIVSLVFVAGILTFIVLIAGLRSSIECASWFVDKSVLNYCESVSSNFGSSGFEVFLLGLLALALTSLFEDYFDRVRYQRELDRSRSDSKSSDLNRIFSRFSTKLDLSGLLFQHDKIESLVIRAVAFGSVRRKSSRLEHITLLNCTLDKIDARACELFDVSIVKSTLNNCIFVNCKITNPRADRPFLDDSQVRGLAFDGATLTGVNLSNLSAGRCSFWGAKLYKSPLPNNLFDRLELTGVISRDENNGWVVSNRWHLLTDYRRARANPRVRDLGLSAWRIISSRVWMSLNMMNFHETYLDRLLLGDR